MRPTAIPIVLAALALAGCGSDTPPAEKDASRAEPSSAAGRMDKVALQLNWFPEAEHGGYYAALVHGFYKDAGLDVEIVGGGVNVPVVALVASGQRTFGVCNADEVLLGRAEEADVVALLAPLQTSPRCIMVHEGSGFDSFDDIRDVTLAMSAGSPFASFLQDKFAFEGVKIVGYAGVTPFAADPKYAMQGYNISEPFVARSLDAKPRVLMVSDAGFNPYTSLLVTSDQWLEGNGDVARRMVEASAKGWERYLSDPDETNRQINGLNAEMGMDILAFGVGQLRPMCETSETKTLGIGCMTAERWETLARQLEELELMKPGDVQPAAAFDARYVPRPGA